MKPAPDKFNGMQVIAHMRVPSKFGEVPHQMVILCEREPDQDWEKTDYTVHHLGADDERPWFGINGEYDIKTVGEAFIVFQEKLVRYGALPPF